MSETSHTDQNVSDTERIERDTIKISQDIIKFMVNGKSYHDHQAARADRNQKLKTVFGIDNAFTTHDRDVKKDFSTNSTNLMQKAVGLEKNPEEDWTALRARAVSYFWEYMNRSPDSTSLKLAEMVQFITLKTSLYYLFPESDGYDSDGAFDDIVYIGDRINKLWIQSKDQSVLTDWSNEIRLHDALKRVTRKKSNSWVNTPRILTEIWNTMQHVAYGDKSPEPTIPSRNPMNLILPAYETMWRVVMRCFLEIRYREAEDGPAWSCIMEQYLKELENPKALKQKAFFKVSEIGVSPMDLVKEAMRLYPPTRRVHRLFNSEPASANIEQCHRFNVLAAPDPLQFSPARWQKIAAEILKKPENKDRDEKTIIKLGEGRLGFMPFAFHCPSSKSETKGFGFKMVGLLVAVLCAHIGDEWQLGHVLEVEELAGMDEESSHQAPLKSERQDYEDLELTK